jgi:phosphoribosyl 1,2-cyclic phosphate phosphodiesterase
MITRKDLGQNIVIDTGPDFRTQMLREKVKSIEGVFYTHTHADHCHGFDDLRPFFFLENKVLTCWLKPDHADELKQRFAYAFDHNLYHGTLPSVAIETVEEGPTEVMGLDIDVAYLPHGPVTTAALRVGSFAYATDFKSFPKEIIKRWQGKIAVMIASGLRYAEHPTHSSIPETIKVFEDLGVKRGIITHLSHDIDYMQASKGLPPGVELAFDGMRVDL